MSLPQLDLHAVNLGRELEQGMDSALVESLATSGITDPIHKLNTAIRAAMDHGQRTPSAARLHQPRHCPGGMCPHRLLEWPRGALVGPAPAAQGPLCAAWGGAVERLRRRRRWPRRAVGRHDAPFALLLSVHACPALTVRASIFPRIVLCKCLAAEGDFRVKLVQGAVPRNIRQGLP